MVVSTELMYDIILKGNMVSFTNQPMSDNGGIVSTNVYEYEGSYYLAVSHDLDDRFIKLIKLV